MIDNTALAYPADYYYPEFIYSREDAPPTSPGLHLPLSSVDNGIGSTTATIPGTVQEINEVHTRQQQHYNPATPLAGNIMTNQGLPDMDITQTTRTDPRTNLVRDPAERNIPKLIVDDSVIRQSVRTSTGGAMNFNNTPDRTNGYNQLHDGRASTNNGRISMNNGYTNGYLASQTRYDNSGKKHMGTYRENEQQMIDDRWKKEVVIGDNGVVSIDPVVYEEPVYDGPFGLTRTGSYIFYIGMAVFTLLAVIFLIMCGVFYAQSYPTASTNAGKLAGVGICAFAFYLGLQLILIGIWHQKHRKENPKPIVRSKQSYTKTKRQIAAEAEDDQDIYNYAYQPQSDFAPYGNYPNPPYAPYGNEQIPLQSTTPGTVVYPPNYWPVNVEQEAQPTMDARFLQPMEWTYGAQTTNGTSSTAEKVTLNSNHEKTEKRKNEKKSRKKKNAVEVDVTKPKSASTFQIPTIIEPPPPLPRMKKAPETKELIERIVEIEENQERASSPSALTVQNVSRIKSMDDDDPNDTVLADRRHRHSDRHTHTTDHSHRKHSHHHHQHRSHHHSRHHRQRSHSPCSICSREEFYSDVGHDAHRSHHHHHHHPHPELIPTHFVIAPPPIPVHAPTKLYRDSSVATEHQLKITRDSSVTADLEDISNEHNNSFHQVPIVRRTVIVEPYPAEPTSQVVLTPRTTAIRKFHSDDNLNVNGDNDKILYSHAPSVAKKSKRKKSKTESRDNIIEDLDLEDVNELDHSNSRADSRKRTKKLIKTSATKTISNAFYEN
ncbi:unnamed protein product [Adineta ricciae]|uniref:Uncharacterized protein n=1 Tax=Adineta ricciae TaxID=249248 RepID=A0A813NXE4_ADIRI|nr:unnamed protein product [Adineta ricciae]CAF0800191.1 unnamed protein product [Adineta ricciae]